MKKLMNSADEFVADTLRGMGAAHPELVRVDVENGLVLRAAEPRPGKVGLVSGGGSGHEPLHGGYVGVGMLDAAVCGAVFTSPTPEPILTATKHVNAGAGVLHIVKNYTGDVMNFEMAAELADAEGVEVKSVVVADDVAVEDSTWTAGRRGVGLTVFVEKIVGAAAEAGRDLAACAELATRICDAGRSFGVATQACIVPAVGRASFDLADDQMEVGVGIHGEPGRTTSPMLSAHDTAEVLVEAVLADRDFTGTTTIVMLNGMGSTPLAEQYIVYASVTEALGKAGVQVARTLVGNHITALDMQGVSLTVLGADDDMIELWDAPVNTPGLRWGC